MLRTKRLLQILAFLTVIAALSCSRPAPGSTPRTGVNRPETTDAPRSDRYGAAVKLASLADRSVKESSGVVASRRHPGIYWTHNDSGDEPLIYAFDGTGKSAGVWRVAGAVADDWEDIAAGPGPERGTNYLYIGDIGDNGSDRDEVIVYRVPEPAITPADANPSSSSPRTTERAEPLYLRYPDGKHNAETLLVHPQTGDVYLVTKSTKNAAAVYRVTAAALLEPRVQTLTKIADLALPSVLEGMVTGGDISSDGQRVVLCDYFAGYEYTLGSASSGFDSIWREKPLLIDLGAREQGEAVCYSLDGKSILSTSEGSPTTVFETKIK